MTSVDALDNVARVRDLLTRALIPAVGRNNALLVVELAQRVLPRADVEQLGHLLGEAERLAVPMPRVYEQLRRRASRVLALVLAMDDVTRVQVTSSLHHANFLNLQGIAERLRAAL